MPVWLSVLVRTIGWSFIVIGMSLVVSAWTVAYPARLG